MISVVVDTIRPRQLCWWNSTKDTKRQEKRGFSQSVNVFGWKIHRFRPLYDSPQSNCFEQKATISVLYKFQSIPLVVTKPHWYWNWTKKNLFDTFPIQLLIFSIVRNRSNRSNRSNSCRVWSMTHVPQPIEWEKEKERNREKKVNKMCWERYFPVPSSSYTTNKKQ